MIRKTLLGIVAAAGIVLAQEPDSIVRDSAYWAAKEDTWAQEWKEQMESVPSLDSVQAELRKLDSILVDDIEQNYTIPHQEKRVVLRVGDASDMLLIAWTTAAGAAYCPDHDMLVVAGHNEQSISHEIVHLIDDDRGLKGILHQDGYTGPGAEERTAFFTHRFSQPPLDSLRDDLLRRESRNIQGRIRSRGWSYVHEYAALFQTAYYMLYNHKLHQQSAAQLHGTPVDTLTIALDTLDAGLRSDLAAFDSAGMDAVIHWTDLESMTPEWDTNPEQASLRIQQRRTELLSVISRFDSIALPLKRQLDELVQQAPYDSNLSFPPPDYILNQFGWMFWPEWDNITEEREYYLENTGENLARMVSCMYNLYFGPTTLENQPLCEEDLSFLSTFSFRGVPLFAKGIEKYRVGMSMIKEGMTPEHVKAALEYATRFSYQGQEHSWQETPFSINGSEFLLRVNHDELRTIDEFK
jgi:hypothetical protein